jgi:hypothetical protein
MWNRNRARLSTLQTAKLSGNIPQVHAKGRRERLHYEQIRPLKAQLSLKPI